MATLTRVTTPSLSTRTPCPAHRQSGIAGEAVTAGMTAYMKSDGKYWKTSGAAATAPALYVGVVLADAGADEAVTVGWGLILNYGSGLTPGARYYVSATAGSLDDAATTGGTVAVAYAVDATQVFFFPPTR